MVLATFIMPRPKGEVIRRNRWRTLSLDRLRAAEHGRAAGAGILASPITPPSCLRSAPRRPRGGENSPALHQTKGGGVCCPMSRCFLAASGGACWRITRQGLASVSREGRTWLGWAGQGSLLPRVPRREATLAPRHPRARRRDDPLGSCAGILRAAGTLQCWWERSTVVAVAN